MMSVTEILVLFLTFCSIQLRVLTEDTESVSVEKRAPGWGKRDSPSKLGYLESVLTDLSRFEMNRQANTDNFEIDSIAKRRPGWGKRSYSYEYDLEKRKPGWGKRASFDTTDSLDVKRTPGWGKRSYMVDEDNYEDERSKRRPGWGKRSTNFAGLSMDKRRPGWGKRAPGWGKRSDNGETECSTLLKEIRILQMKLAQMKDDLPQTCTGEIYDDDTVVYNS